MIAQIATATLAAMAMGGDADGATVAIPGRFYAPQRATVLVGQAVTWRNDDTSDHTVTSPDGGFDSGRIGGGSTYSFTFDQPGSYDYHCTIHRYMRGTVEVDTLALAAPAAPTTAGGQAVLTGRAPAGTGEVALERLGPGGTIQAAGTATPDAAGRFRFAVAADAPASYRARSGALESSAVPVAVAPRLTLTARRTGRRVSAQVHAEPPQPGARVVLERYVLERFGWQRVRAATLSAQSAASFAIGPVGSVQLRARVAKPVRGYAPAVSRPAAAAAGHH